MAVVGSSGHAARVSAPTIAATHGARLVGVLGSTAERGRALAERYPGCHAYADLDELCADPGVHAVWVAGPNDRHVEHATRCLAAGKHVLLEKPMATTSTGAERLLELARDTERTLTVAFQHRFRPAHRWLREAVRTDRWATSGSCGSIASGRFRTTRGCPTTRRRPGGPRSSTAVDGR